MGCFPVRVAKVDGDRCLGDAGLYASEGGRHDERKYVAEVLLSVLLDLIGMRDTSIFGSGNAESACGTLCIFGPYPCFRRPPALRQLWYY